MIELLRKEGSFHKVRIGALVKQAHVPPGDFYRQFSGKRECFAVAYEQLLGELIAEVRAQLDSEPPTADPASGGSAEPRHEVPECPAEHTRHDVPALLGSLAEALNSDRERRRILIVEMAHLPDAAATDIDGARKGDLSAAIAGLLAAGVNTDRGDATVTFAASAIVEVIRSSEVSGRNPLTPGAFGAALHSLQPHGARSDVSALAA